MSNSADVLNKISLAANAFAQAIGRATAPPGTVGYQPYGYQPGYAPQAIPQPHQMPRDNVGWGTLAPAPGQTAPPPQAGGVMGALSAIWQSIVDFFRRLFRGVTSPAPATPGAPPAAGAVSGDARVQAFNTFPTGSGLALGFIPVSSQRHGNQIVVTASGFGQARVYWQGNQLYFQQDSKQPVLVDRMTANRQATGDTRYDIVMQGGKTVTAELLADGRTLRYQGYSITLS